MSISALEQGLRVPRSNPPFPFQRIGVAPVPEPEEYAHTSGKCSGDGKGMSTDVVGIVAALGEGTPVAMAGDN